MLRFDATRQIAASPSPAMLPTPPEARLREVYLLSDRVADAEMRSHADGGDAFMAAGRAPDPAGHRPAAILRTVRASALRPGRTAAEALSDSPYRHNPPSGP